jgi:methyl-accepting chemotaxis protein
MRRPSRGGEPRKGKDRGVESAYREGRRVVDGPPWGEQDHRRHREPNEPSRDERRDRGRPRGDAGAGFAVVADEIRSLAEKSSAQSKSIAQQLKEVAAAIENAVGSSRQASVGFDEVLGLINAVTTMETENTMALREQRTGSDQVAETLAEMRETTESVNQVAASLSADSEQLERAIHRLSECSARAQSEMAEIARDIEKINGCFAQVAELKEKNSQTFGSVSEQVDRFIL